MSDFDKEAERERLREKYERDQRKREASERMSDLLLKGATMTNAHCDDCGDPIFRYEGEEFCPTCQEVVAEGDDAGAGGTDGTDGTNGADDASAANADPSTDSPADASEDRAADATDPTGEATDPTGGATDPTGDATDPTGDATDPTGDAGRNSDDGGDRTTPDHIEIKRPAGRSDDAAGEVAASDAGGSDESRTGQTGPAGDETRGAPAESTGTGDDLTAARQSLVRTLRAQARRAENCDDPRRARDHLAAAREAAETLSAFPY